MSERRWTLKRTVHDVRRGGTLDGRPYTYRLPRVVRIPGLCALHGYLVVSTEHFVLGVTAWRADPDDGGSAGFRVGVGLVQWEVYVGRLWSKRAVRRRMERELVAEVEGHLGADA